MKPGLISFIFISATAHLAVLNYGSQWTMDLNEKNEQGSSNFAVEILYTKKTETEPQKPITESPINNQPQVQTVAQTREIISVKKKNPLFSNATNNKLKNNQDEKPNTANSTAEKKPDTEKIIDKNNQLSEATINKAIKEELKKYFYYPKAAIRRDWQGKLLVSFNVLEDGSIENISVTESSGYKILDDAAVNAVGKIKLTVESSQLTFGSETKRSLPIAYKLN